MSETSLFRAEHISADDSGDIQTVDAYGHASEQFQQVLRIQPHGFSSNPPAGSHGIGLRLRGESDVAVILGFEHPDKRPKNLPEGESAFYNDASKVLLQTSGDDLNLTMPGTWTLKAKSFVFDVGGGVTLTLDSAGFHFAGGKVDHNGHDIGATHQHKDTQPGSGLSGVPQ